MTDNTNDTFNVLVEFDDGGSIRRVADDDDVDELVQLSGRSHEAVETTLGTIKL